MDFKVMDKDRLQLAYEIQKEIFPEALDYVHFLETLESDNVDEVWIAFEGDAPIGISGVYTVDTDPQSIWLSWLGVLPQYRGQGYGTKILLQSIEKCKEFGQFKYVRLYTSETGNASALPLYNAKMDLCERYENSDDDSMGGTALIYSSSLTDEKVTPWNNRYLGIKEFESNRVEGEKELEG